SCGGTRLFFLSSRRRHTRFSRDWSSDVCSSDLSSDLAAQASALKYTFTVIDMHGCSDKAEALRRFAAALHFPAWFGHNWDALGRSEERRVGKEWRARWQPYR